MSARHAGRPRAALAATAVALLSGLLVSGCSDSGVNWDSLNQKVHEGVDKARGSVDDITAKSADAGLAPETLSEVQDATASAGDAISQARTALETASAAGQTASTEIATAKTALDTAKAKVEALSGKVSGPLATAISSLADQLDTLAAELAEAS